MLELVNSVQHGVSQQGVLADLMDVVELSHTINL